MYEQVYARRKDDTSLGAKAAASPTSRLQEQPRKLTDGGVAMVALAGAPIVAPSREFETTAA
jgi:hypothetical protein